MRRLIVNFHGIGAPSQYVDAAEARYWVSSEILHEVLHLGYDLQKEVELSVTFDDGNLSDLTLAAPILADYGVKACFFVLSERLASENFLSPANLREMIAAGHRIGLHGAGHRDWRYLTPAQRLNEWSEARARLEEATGAAITEVAIPFGAYNRAVLQGLKAEGFERVYSSCGGQVYDNTWPIPRTSIRRDMQISRLKDLILGRESAYQRGRRALSRWCKQRL